MVESSSNHTYTVLQEFKTLRGKIEDLYSKRILNVMTPTSSDVSKQCQFEVVKESVKKLEKELDEAKTALCATYETVCNLREDHERLKEEIEGKTMKQKIEASKKAELEEEYALLKKLKISSQDEQFLETIKLQYKAVRNITQVRFQYPTSKSSTLCGYVFNKTNNSVTHFIFDRAFEDPDVPKEKTQQGLMVLMEKMSETKTPAPH